jgi:hypothetical protein
MCVTGTYRKVDSAYVLTSDLVGLGARKLILAAWKESFDKKVSSRVGLWRQKIFASGTYSKIAFDPQDPLAPDDNARKQMDVATNGNDNISTGSLTQAIRDMLSQVGRSWGRSNPVNQDRVGFESQIEYGFVLPNGKALHPEIQTLGTHSTFASSSGPQQEQPEETALDPFPGESTASHPILVSAESPSEATKLVAVAREHGFTDLWLEAHDKATLAAAIGKGIRIDLVIRPWKGYGEPSNRIEDLNIWADTGSELALRRAELSDWKDCQNTAGGLFGECPPLYDLVSPIDPATRQMQSALAKLAHTPGLAGVVVLDTEPGGYEPSDGATLFAGFSRPLAVLHEFGYTPQLRLAFLREKHVDPIDLAPEVLTLDFDIQQPFFMDDRLGVWNVRSKNANPEFTHLSDDWFSYRANLNSKAMDSFFDQLSDLSTPVMVAPRIATAHTPPYMSHGVAPWIPGQPVPQLSWEKAHSQQGRIPFYSFNEQSSQAAALTMARMMQSPKFPLAVDATGVKPEALDNMISKWFSKPALK